MKILSYLAVGVVGLISSPFVLLAMALIIGLVFGAITLVVGLALTLLAWAIPFLISIGVSILAFKLVADLLDN